MNKKRRKSQICMSNPIKKDDLGTCLMDIDENVREQKYGETVAYNKCSGQQKPP